MTIITKLNQITRTFAASTTQIILSRIDFFNKTTTTQTTKPNITFGPNVFLYGCLNLFMGYSYNHILCTQNFCLVEIQQINIATTPTFYTVSNPCNGSVFLNFTNITIMANQPNVPIRRYTNFFKMGNYFHAHAHRIFVVLFPPTST